MVMKILLKMLCHAKRRDISAVETGFLKKEQLENLRIVIMLFRSSSRSRIFISFLCWAFSASGFAQHPYAFSLRKFSSPARYSQKWQLHIVTEKQVEEALVASENLWNKVLDLRKRADEAAEKAEAIRASSSQDSDENSNGDGGKKHDTAHLNCNSISLAGLGDSMEADQYIKEAEDLIEEADTLEYKAKKALEETEKLLEQHLKDFPDSPLAVE